MSFPAFKKESLTPVVYTLLVAILVIFIIFGLVGIESYDLLSALLFWLVLFASIITRKQSKVILYFSVFSFIFYTDFFLLKTDVFRYSKGPVVYQNSEVFSLFHCMWQISAFTILVLDLIIPKRVPKPVTLGRSSILSIVIVAIALFPYLPILSGGFSEIMRSLMLMRMLNLEIGSVQVYIITIATVIGSRSFYLLIKRGVSLIDIIIFASTFLITLLSGTRFKLLILCAPGLLFFQINGSRINKLIGIVGAIAVVAISSFQVSTRSVDDKISFSDYINTGFDHSDAFAASVALQQEVGSQYQPWVNHGLEYLIPRSLYREKGEPLYWSLFNQRYASIGNITPGIFGQYYINYGLAGALFVGMNLFILFYIGTQLQSAKGDFSFLGISVLAIVFLSYRNLSMMYIFYILVASIFYLGRRKKENILV